MSGTSNQKREFLVIAEINFLPGRVNYSAASPLLTEDEAQQALKHLETQGVKANAVCVEG